MARATVPPLSLTGLAEGDTVIGVQNGATKRFPVVGLAVMAEFQQGGSGAVSRSAQAKLREVVSVADFGASSASSAATNAAAFASAISYADALGDATVLVPAGLYSVSAVSFSGKTFRIEFARGALVQASASMAAVFALSGCDAVFADVGSSRVDLQACKLEYSIVSPK